jgi:hypothetical protein
MNRITSLAALAAGALTVTAIASAPASAGYRAPSAAKPATSLGVIGVGDNKIEYLDSLAGGAPKVLKVITAKYADGIDGTALDASGTSSLIGSDLGAALAITKSRTTPTVSPQIDLNAFGDEGGDDYHFYSEGIAISGNAALVSSDERGVAQLIRKAGRWQIDTRVYFPGKTDAGFQRARGFIPFPHDLDAKNYDGIVTSPTALPNGKYLAVATAREDGSGTFAVIEGVGTAKPKVGTLVDPTLESAGYGPDEGTGGVAFSPATPRRAVATTPSGFVVVNLTNPLKPALQSPTTVGTAELARSISVSADGDHVAELVGDDVYVYSGLLTTAASAPLTLVATISLGDAPNSDNKPNGFDVAYLANNTLAVSHGDDTSGYKLTMYSEATSSTPVAHGSVALAGEPDGANSLSVWPSSVPPTIHPGRLLPGARVGKKVSQKLSVSGGVGTFTLKVTAGKLPKGLKLHGGTIAGKPKHAGTAHVTITASNKYGGSVSVADAVKIAAKR